MKLLIEYMREHRGVMVDYFRDRELMCEGCGGVTEFIDLGFDGHFHCGKCERNFTMGWLLRGDVVRKKV